MKTILGMAVATLLFASGSANAAEISPSKMNTFSIPEVSQTLLEPVQSRRCRRWRRDCAWRWGWGGRRFRRCVRRRGC
jgi:hypothetical protein